MGQLVGRSLVQVVEHKYRLHDLVLAFAKSKLRCLKMGCVALVTSRQAQYLSRLSVLRKYAEAGEMLGGFYALIGLWASVEELSRDSTLQTTMYRAILCELEESEATADMLISYDNVGHLFYLQVGLSGACRVSLRRYLYVCMWHVYDRLYCKDRGVSFLTQNDGCKAQLHIKRS